MKSVLKIARKITLFLALAVLVAGLNINVFAAGTTLSFSKSKLNVGETVNVTVNFSPGKKMYAVEGILSYDSSVLKFISGDGANGSGGSVKIALPASSSSISTILKFKAIGVGSGSISVGDCSYVNSNEQTKSLSGAAAKLSVVDKSALSSDGYLKSLELSDGNLYPAFSKTVYNYSVKVDNNVKSVSVSAVASHNKASVKVSGSDELKVGNNQRVITVTAENGGTKRYTVNIVRLSKDGETASEPPALEVNKDLSVNIEGETYYISNNIENCKKPSGFSVEELDFSGTIVPCYSNKDGYNIIYVTDKSGKNGMPCLYDGNEAVKLKSAKIGANSYILLNGANEQTPVGTAMQEVTVKNHTFSAYKLLNSEDSDFILFYAIGKNGQKDLFCYDAVEDSVVTAPETLFSTQAVVGGVDEPKQTDHQDYFRTVLLFAVSGVLGVMVLVLAIMLLVANKKRG